MQLDFPHIFTLCRSFCLLFAGKLETGQLENHKLGWQCEAACTIGNMTFGGVLGICAVEIAHFRSNWLQVCYRDITGRSSIIHVIAPFLDCICALIALVFVCRPNRICSWFVQINGRGLNQPACLWFPSATHPFELLWLYTDCTFEFEFDVAESFMIGQVDFEETFLGPLQICSRHSRE